MRVTTRLISALIVIGSGFAACGDGASPTGPQPRPPDVDLALDPGALIAEDVAGQRAVAWSADGREVFYSAGRGGTASWLTALDVETGAQRLLTEVTGFVSGLRTTALGAWLYYLRTDATYDQGEIHRIDPSGGEPELVASGVSTGIVGAGPGQGQGGIFELSSDGTRLAYRAGYESSVHPGSLVLLDLTTGALTPVDPSASLAAFSPGGGEVAIYGCRFVETRICTLEVIDVETGVRRTEDIPAHIGDLGRVDGLRWTPGGIQLAVASFPEVNVYDVETGRLSGLDPGSGDVTGYDARHFAGWGAGSGVTLWESRCYANPGLFGCGVVRHVLYTFSTVSAAATRAAVTESAGHVWTSPNGPHLVYTRLNELYLVSTDG